MTTGADPLEEGQRAARKNIPAKAKSVSGRQREYSLWAAGHQCIAGAAEANESEDT